MTGDFLKEFNSAFKFDRRLFAVEVRVSIAYCDELFGAGIFTRLEAERAKSALYSILKRAEHDKNYFSELPSEDIYSFVETRLVQLIGETGRKLRVGRSRIDQSATVFRLWLREKIEEILASAGELQKAFIATAENNREAVLPGYAQLRRAQPILFAHWCLAFFEMLARDRERFDEAWRRVNVLPLGSGEAAGTSFEIDRESLARTLNFEGITANSLDAVSDRDFAVEFVGACCLLMIHLSRFAEDLILYSTAEFGFVAFNNSNESAPGKFVSALELIRGKAGRIFGHHTSLLSTLKGLPLGFNKDLHEDQQIIFDAVDTVSDCLRAAVIVIENLRVNADITRRAAINYFNSGELSDYLIHRDLTVSSANHIVEQIVRHAEAENKRLEDLSLAEMREFSGEIEPDVFENLTLEQTLASRNQIGGTSPERVFEALEQAKESLARE